MTVQQLIERLQKAPPNAVPLMTIAGKYYVIRNIDIGLADCYVEEDTGVLQGTYTVDFTMYEVV